MAQELSSGTKDAVTQSVEKQTTNAVNDAHNTSAQKASEKLIKEMTNTGAAVPAGTNETDGQVRKEYSARMSKELADKGLLPSVSLEYAREVFKEIDVNDDKSVTEKELKTARDKATEGSVEQMLLSETLKMMQKNNLKDISADDIDVRLRNQDKNIQKEDQQFALAAAQVLDKKGMIQAIDNAGDKRGDTHDGLIGPKDIADYAASLPDDNPDKKKLNWLAEHWDDPDVRKMQTPTDGHWINAESNTNGIATLKADLASQPETERTGKDPKEQRREKEAQQKEKDTVAQIAQTSEYKDLTSKGYVLDRSDKGHQEVYKAADGSIVAIDRDKPGGKPISYTYGDEKNGYKGYKLFHDDKGVQPDRWEHYEGDTDDSGKPVAKAITNSVKVVNGKVEPGDEYVRLIPN